MILLKTFTKEQKLTEKDKQVLITFLYKHLGEYGDPELDIEKCIDYAMQEHPTYGGSVIIAKKEDEIVGAVILNKTGMKGYIPENILVYIATHINHRGIGIGKLLMKEAINQTEGNIALHVEENNPARHLYEKVGFNVKYLEMRLIKE